MPLHAGPIRILLVDDHEHVLWGLQKLIEGEWPHMTVAATVKTMTQAVAAVESLALDIVVLDIFLGETNSLDRMSDLVASGAPPVVILTGSRDVDLHRRALGGGARAVVLKDEPAEVLLGEIERVHLRNGVTARAHPEFAGER